MAIHYWILGSFLTGHHGYHIFSHMVIILLLLRMKHTLLLVLLLIEDRNIQRRGNLQGRRYRYLAAATLEGNPRDTIRWIT